MISFPGKDNLRRKAISFLWAGILILLLLGLDVPVATPPVLAQAPLETITLQLKWQHQFQFAGYYKELAGFSHGICPECKVKLYPEIFGDRQP